MPFSNAHHIKDVRLRNIQQTLWLHILCLEVPYVHDSCTCLWTKTFPLLSLLVSHARHLAVGIIFKSLIVTWCGSNAIVFAVFLRLVLKNLYFTVWRQICLHLETWCFYFLMLSFLLGILSVISLSQIITGPKLILHG